MGMAVGSPALSSATVTAADAQSATYTHVYNGENGGGGGGIGAKRRRIDVESELEAGLVHARSGPGAEGTGERIGESERPSQRSRSRATSEISASQSATSATSAAMEYLPAYDAERSPTYEMSDPHPSSRSHSHAHYSHHQHAYYPQPGQGQGQGLGQGEGHHERTPSNASQSRQLSNNTWQTRLLVSTSGLGVAMSTESLRSLKYCLSWLRWANTRLARLLWHLQSALAEWETVRNRPSPNSQQGQQSQQQQQQQHHLREGEQRHPYARSDVGDGARDGMDGRSSDSAHLTERIAALKAECVATLKAALDVVSKYAGGALPENARLLVRRHLVSLPQRFRLAALTEQPEEEDGRIAPLLAEGVESGGAASNGERARGEGRDVGGETGREQETVRGARKVVVLAREGLDMMGQVSAVVDGTIVSAEEWCERLGRRPQEQQQQQQQQQHQQLDREQGLGQGSGQGGAHELQPGLIGGHGEDPGRGQSGTSEGGGLRDTEARMEG